MSEILCQKTFLTWLPTKNISDMAFFYFCISDKNISSRNGHVELFAIGLELQQTPEGEKARIIYDARPVNTVIPDLPFKLPSVRTVLDLYF